MSWAWRLLDPRGRSAIADVAGSEPVVPGRLVRSGPLDLTLLSSYEARRASALLALTPRLRARLLGVDPLPPPAEPSRLRVRFQGAVDASAGSFALRWRLEVTAIPGRSTTSGERGPLSPGRFEVWLEDGWHGGHDDAVAGLGMGVVNFHAAREDGTIPQAAEHLRAWLRARLARAERLAADPSPPAAAVAEILGLSTTARGDPLRLLALSPEPGDARQLRALDAIGRRLARDLDLQAAVRSLVGPDTDAETLADRAARFLPGRLLRGDADALAEPDFETRFTRARRAAGLSSWWFFRLALETSDARLRRFALGELARLELPDALLFQIARSVPRPFPDTLAARVAAFELTRTRRRAFGLVAGAFAWGLLLLGAAAAAADIVRRLRGRARRVWPGPALAAWTLVATTVDLRFGPWSALPWEFGLAGLMVAAGATLRRRSRRAGASAVLLLAAAIAAATVAWSWRSQTAARLATTLAGLGLAAYALLLPDAHGELRGVGRPAARACAAWLAATTIAAAAAPARSFLLEPTLRGAAAVGLAGLAGLSAVAARRAWIRSR